MKLIAVEYCPMIYESEYETISIHETKRGAAKSMSKLKSVHFEEALEVLELNMETFEEYGSLRIEELNKTNFNSYRYRYFTLED